MGNLYITTRKYTSFLLVYFLCVGVLMLMAGRAEAQLVYADTQSNVSNVANPGNATTNSDLTDFATMNSSILASSTIRLTFSSNTFAANSTAYIKYSSSVILSGFSFETYNGASTNAAATTSGTSLTAPDGTKYLAVTCSNAFNAVKITLSGLAASANIYYAFFAPPGSVCNNPVATTTTLTGVSLATINDPNYAIDGNMGTASDFNFILSLLGTLSQTIYYQGTSSAGDMASFTISVPAAVLSAGLFSSTQIKIYNGSVQVGSTISLNNTLSLDLLGLMATGNPYTTAFTPAGPFNRIVVTMSSATGLLNRLFLHEVSITPPKPIFTLPNNDTVNVCYGTPATLVADVPASTSNELVWFSSAVATNTTVLYTGTSYTLPFNSISDTLFWVASRKTGCTGTSERVPVYVHVNPLPTLTFSGARYGCRAQTFFLFAYSGTGNNPVTYSITWGAGATTAFFPPWNNIAWAASPLSITMPNTAPAATYSGNFIVLRNNNNCTNSYPFSLIIQDPPVGQTITTFQ